MLAAALAQRGARAGRGLARGDLGAARRRGCLRAGGTGGRARVLQRARASAPRPSSGAGRRTSPRCCSDLFSAPGAAGANPVQVMTIHRAKGLEFDHVFVPALDRRPPAAPSGACCAGSTCRARPATSDLLIAPGPGDRRGGGGELDALPQGALRRARRARARAPHVRRRHARARDAVALRRHRRVDRPTAQ